MRKILSVLMATTLFCALTITAGAAPQCPDRIVPGELENNAVLGAEWVESDTFIPVSTGVGDVKRSRDDVTGMTAVITHVNPVYTGTAQKIASKLGANIVGGFHIVLPTGLTEAGVTFDVKEGFTLPENPVFISLHGKVFCTPKMIRRINDRKFVMIFNASDTDFYMLDGGSLALDQHTSYRDFFQNQ
ncbi:MULTISPECIES: hypothetical protein [unclassified Butyrivibrio]|uniref:hypothetical protein n=1 Tax=unclassified Butyrivibrio TaxID=2639466 RepID=UPI0004197145|nr:MULTISPECIES: hypothetical protein [unclassified Butyrivibrio]